MNTTIQHHMDKEQHIESLKLKTDEGRDFSVVNIDGLSIFDSDGLENFKRLYAEIGKLIKEEGKK